MTGKTRRMPRDAATWTPERGDVIYTKRLIRGVGARDMKRIRTVFDEVLSVAHAVAGEVLAASFNRQRVEVMVPTFNDALRVGGRLRLGSGGWINVIGTRVDPIAVQGVRADVDVHVFFRDGYHHSTPAAGLAAQPPVAARIGAAGVTKPEGTQHE